MVERAGIIRTARKLMDGTVFPRPVSPGTRSRRRTPTRTRPPPSTRRRRALRRPLPRVRPRRRFPFSPDRSYTPPDAGSTTSSGSTPAWGCRAPSSSRPAATAPTTPPCSTRLRRGRPLRGRGHDRRHHHRRRAGRAARRRRAGHPVQLRRPPRRRPGPRRLRPDRGPRRRPGWHLVLHFDAADLAAYAGLLARMPCPYVIDHMARVDAAAGLDQEPFRALLGCSATTAAGSRSPAPSG